MSAHTMTENALSPSGQAHVALSMVMETHQRLIHIMMALVAANILLLGGAIGLSVLDDDAMLDSSSDTGGAEAQVLPAEPGTTHAQAAAPDAKPSSSFTTPSSIASEMLNPIEDAFLSDPERKLLNDRGIK